MYLYLQWTIPHFIMYLFKVAKKNKSPHLKTGKCVDCMATLSAFAGETPRRRKESTGPGKGETPLEDG